MDKNQQPFCASYLALIRDNKILLLRRANTGYRDGFYSLVAGKCHEHENFTDTMIREAREEANIILKREDIEVVHIMHRKASSNVDWVDTFFIANNYEGEIKNMEEHKCSDLGWFFLDNLPENTIPCIKNAIKNILEKKFYSEFGF